jgi:hypothetical protein
MNPEEFVALTLPRSEWEALLRALDKVGMPLYAREAHRHLKAQMEDNS